MLGPINTLSKSVLLVFLYFLASLIAVSGVSMFADMPAAVPHLDFVSHVLPMMVLEVAALVLLARSLRCRFVVGCLILMLFYHCTKYGLMMVEAYFYLNLWNQPPLMSLEEIVAVEAMGLIVSVLICPAAVLLFKPKFDLHDGVNSINATVSHRARLYLYGASIYAACYLIAGALILIPLAGDSFAVTYQNLAVPFWMPLLQLARGLVWVCLIDFYLTNRVIGGATQSFKIGMLVGAALVVFASAQLLIPNTLMPRYLQFAHIIELSVSMLLFGWLLTRLWFRQFEGANSSNNHRFAS